MNSELSIGAFVINFFFFFESRIVIPDHAKYQCVFITPTAVVQCWEIEFAVILIPLQMLHSGTHI